MQAVVYLEMATGKDRGRRPSAVAAETPKDHRMTVTRAAATDDGFALAC